MKTGSLRFSRRRGVFRRKKVALFILERGSRDEAANSLSVQILAETVFLVFNRRGNWKYAGFNYMEMCLLYADVSSNKGNIYFISSVSITFFRDQHLGYLSQLII